MVDQRHNRCRSLTKLDNFSYDSHFIFPATKRYLMVIVAYTFNIKGAKKSVLCLQLVNFTKK